MMSHSFCNIAIRAATLSLCRATRSATTFAGLRQSRSCTPNLIYNSSKSFSTPHRYLSNHSTATGSLERDSDSKRHFSSLASVITDVAAKTASNGILESDDFYKKGLPAPRYILSKSSDPNISKKSLTTIFAEHAHVDPFQLIAADIRNLSDSLREVIGSDHPVLERIARYFFEVPGKRVRPAVVLLISRALAAASTTPTSGASDTILPEQRRLSEITEMIHTASLLHDDVIDEADSRRGVPSVNQIFGNKLAILGGDYLLARASLALARLRHADVIELLSQVIEHLVKGEVMQMKMSDFKPNQVFQQVEYYTTKSFYKTGSLFANSCKAAALLGNHDTELAQVAYEYGKYLGLCFQIVDDLLDFIGTSDIMGKPVHHDMQQGHATLPVLYAAQQFPEMQAIVARRFKEVGDIEKAMGFIERSDGIHKARQYAIECAENAVAALSVLPSSPARSALIRLVALVLNRDR